MSVLVPWPIALVRRGAAKCMRLIWIKEVPRIGIKRGVRDEDEGGAAAGAKGFK